MCARVAQVSAIVEDNSSYIIISFLFKARIVEVTDKNVFIFILHNVSIVHSTPCKLWNISQRNIFFITLHKISFRGKRMRPQFFFHHRHFLVYTSRINVCKTNNQDQAQG